MSSEVKLSGDAAGRIILQGNDTITTDQTFTFPDTGGELATKAAGTPPAVGYQEGIWTPKIAQNNNLAQIATSYTNQVGRYVRQGNLVTAFCTLNLTNSSGMSSTTQPLCVIDFPYKCVNDPEHHGISSSVHANGWTDNSVVTVNLLMANNTSRTNPIYWATSSKTSNYGEVLYVHIGTGSLIFSMTYRTDDTTWTPINGATVS